MRALRLALLFGGFGLLPLWASVILVYAGSLQARNADYWNAAPWLIVFAIPCSAITLAIAGVTCAVYRATKGSNAQKLTRAVGVFVLLLAMVLGAAGFLWNRHKATEAALAADKEAAKQFVEQHADVLAAAPNGFTVSLHSSTVAKGVAVAFTFGVRSSQEPNEYLRVVVDVSRATGQADFRLRCVVPENYYLSGQAGTDRCEPKRNRQ